MTQTIRLAISTCPNDTFAFHALLQREVSWRGYEFDIELLDIDQLNQGALAGRFDVVKVSFHAALYLAKDYWVLPCGSALGFGVGPLLLAAQPDSTPQDWPLAAGSNLPRNRHVRPKVLCPGALTTATLLFRMFYDQPVDLKQVVFSEIMPQLQRNEADFGVCIHEGRFTWQEAGLFCVADLGQMWEQSTSAPLPLGGLVARRSLPFPVLTDVLQVIRDSLLWAQANPNAALGSMRQYAQEFDDRVLMQHVELYVNQWTLDLGEAGRVALSELDQWTREKGLIDGVTAPLEIVNG